jgi:hypothetical protein
VRASEDAEAEMSTQPDACGDSSERKRLQIQMEDPREGCTKARHLLNE